MAKNKNGIFDNLDEEIPSGIFDIFKKNKIQCRIIYEDGSYKDFYKKFNDSYIIEIKKRTYFVNPRCIIRGKYPFVVWFFNNPMPINFDYQQSGVSALELIEKDKQKKLTDEQRQIYANIKVDSEGLQAVFNTKLMKGLYSNGGLTIFNLLIIIAVIGVVILVILQLTGTIDINAIIGGK